MNNLNELVDACVKTCESGRVGLYQFPNKEETYCLCPRDAECNYHSGKEGFLKYCDCAEYGGWIK